MHLGMIGAGTSDSPQQTVLEKEAIGPDLKAVAFFPPLTKGDESRIVVKLTDRKTEKHISKAQISIRVFSVQDGEHDSMSQGGMMMMHQMDTSQSHTMQMNHDIDMEISVSEPSEIGTYNAYFKPSKSGSYKFVVTLVSVEGYTLEKPIVIEGTRVVNPMGENHGGMGGMMGMGDSSNYFIIGGIIMGAMMIVVLAFSGKMF
jgi:hypothetical protein